MTPLVFRIAGVRFKIDAAVVHLFRRHVQNGPHRPEAGGVLLGRQIRETCDSVVDRASTPMPRDERGRLFFNRRDPGHQVFMDEAWKASEGTTVYLGEWHTHPEPVPRPSGVDLHDWRRRLKHDDVPSQETFFVIVGKSEVCVWRGDRRSGAIRQMRADHVERFSEGGVMMAGKKSTAKGKNKPARKSPTTQSSKKEAAEYKDVTKSRHIKDPIRWALIAAAGGKCEFRGCRRYLFEHHVTKDVGNFAELAHIIAFKPSGPRGFEGARPEDVHALENLLLLCPTCHHKIDTQEEKYPAAKLRRWKREHEDRVRWLLDLAEESECAVLEIWTDLSNPPVVRSQEKVVRAIQPLYPSKSHWEPIDLAGNNLGDATLVQAARDAIDARVHQLFKSHGERPPKVAVIGITHMPLLAYLGGRLGDRVDVDLFQHHRDTSDWIWKDEPAKADFATKKLQDGSDPAKVALILSLSDPVVPERGLSGSTVPLDASFTIYETRLSSADPNRDFLRTRDDLERFRQEYRDFYAHLAKHHKTLQRLLVLPAVPVPIAIALGMQRLPKIHPTLEIYDEDRQNGGWRHVLDVE